MRSDFVMCTADHEKLLSAPKPLRFATMRIPGRDDDSLQRFILLILDNTGALLELYSDGKKWNGSRHFLARQEDKSSTSTYLFKDIAATDDGVLFGISDGKLICFERLGSWWDGERSEGDANWELIDVVNTTMASGRRVSKPESESETEPEPEPEPWPWDPNVEPSRPKESEQSR